MALRSRSMRKSGRKTNRRRNGKARRATRRVQRGGGFLEERIENAKQAVAEATKELNKDPENPTLKGILSAEKSVLEGLMALQR